MRNPILILVFAIALTSCVSSGRIVEIKDSKKEIDSIKLIQNVSGISVDKTAEATERQYYSISTGYLLEIKKGEKSSLRLDIQIETPSQNPALNLTAFLILDGEKIRIDAIEDGSARLKSRQFIVPENLWVSIANTEKIQYQLFLEKGAIVVKLNDEQVKKLKDFLNRAIRLRNANLPPTPEGLKKL